MNPHPRRRRFLKLLAAASSAGLLSASMDGAIERPASLESGNSSLDGVWQFKTDPQNIGESQQWYAADLSEGWRAVKVPHTWQIEPDLTEYMGVAWYRRAFDAPRNWSDRFVRIEFEAVFHTAEVWVNGSRAGEHVGKGYTAFTVDISPFLKPGQLNNLVVRADNSFNENMLPRGKSSDWAHDGGIYRPVNLIVTPPVFIERVAVESVPDLSAGTAQLDITAVIRNASSAPWSGDLSFLVVDRQTGLPAAASSAPAHERVAPSERREIKLSAAVIQQPKLWHFDHPNLYDLAINLSNGHELTVPFGIRKIELRENKFFLNGEPVRLMGVERMAGSNPMYGMAEPAAWIDRDHRDLKNLNCVYTRVHWQQDRRVLDWCDENGIFIQTEVPTWGSATFKDMSSEPSPEIMNNGLEQLREMITRDRNHPCIFSWGVCNEIGGQNPPAYAFAKRMYEESKRLDPSRLVSYASNSLEKTPGKDVSGLMDYVMFNEYYETWYHGTTDDVRRNLEEIHAAFPNKPVVISEYGYCACVAQRPEGDEHRIRILRTHDGVFRELDYVAGLIFFCYNDYRTHIGDKGTGVCKERIHGVVDLYGNRKPSWEVLRLESSPVSAVHVTGNPELLTIAVSARSAVPAYCLRDYELRGIAFGFADIPLEQQTIALPDITPGQSAEVKLKFATPQPTKIVLDILRPTGFSAFTSNWGY